jgi:adenylylsulfate kinase-like enzyme
MRVARLAKVLSKQSTIIVSVIAPFAETRHEIDELIAPFWVLCSRNGQRSGPDFPYESPRSDQVELVADADAFFSPLENAEKIVNVLWSRVQG